MILGRRDGRAERQGSQLVERARLVAIAAVGVAPTAQGLVGVASAAQGVKAVSRKR